MSAETVNRWKISGVLQQPAFVCVGDYGCRMGYSFLFAGVIFNYTENGSAYMQMKMEKMQEKIPVHFLSTLCSVCKNTNK